jgi:hypothetical protein
MIIKGFNKIIDQPPAKLPVQPWMAAIHVEAIPLAALAPEHKIWHWLVLDQRTGGTK